MEPLKVEVAGKLRKPEWLAPKLVVLAQPPRVSPFRGILTALALCGLFWGLILLSWWALSG